MQYILVPCINANTHNSSIDVGQINAADDMLTHILADYIIQARSPLRL